MANSEKVKAVKYKLCSLKASEIKLNSCFGFGEGLNGVGGAAYLERCQFYATKVTASSCTADTGGTFALIRSVASITSSTFTDSQARMSGGAITYTQLTNTGIQDAMASSWWVNDFFGLYLMQLFSCTFTGCSCGQSGGAVSVTGCGDVFMEQTRFENCASGKVGGAVSLSYSRTSITHCLFLKCTCGGRGTAALTGIDAMKTDSASKHHAKYNIHMTNDRDSGYKSGGGAIFCRNKLKATTKSAFLITEGCCFVGNQCLLPAKTDYLSAGQGFDVNLNETWYISYKDRFWNRESLSVVANIIPDESTLPSQFLAYSTRWYGNDVKFMNSINSGCRDWSDVPDYLSIPPATGFPYDTDDYATVYETTGESLDYEDVSVPTQSKHPWAEATGRPIKMVRTLTEFPFKITARSLITKLNFGSSSYFTASSIFDPTNGFTGTAGFSITIGFTETTSFSGSARFSESLGFSESARFTMSAVLTGSSGFNPTARFSETAQFNQSIDFTVSSSLEASAQFKKTNIFTGTAQFTETVGFTGTAEFTETIGFSKTELTATRLLTRSNILSQTEAFSDSETLTDTEHFTATRSFAATMNFTASSVFSISETFTPWMTRTTAPDGKVISETVIAVSSMTVSETISMTLSYNGKEMIVVYGTVVVPSYVVSYSQIEIFIGGDETVETMSSAVLIGVIAGAGLVIALIVMMVNWFIRQRNEPSDLTSEYTSDVHEIPCANDEEVIMDMNAAWEGHLDASDEKDNHDGIWLDA